MKIATLLLAAFALTLTGIGFAQNKSPSPDAAIKARGDAFMTAWNKHDAKAVAAFWTAEGDLIDPFGESAKGRNEIEQFFQRKFADEFKVSANTITSQSVRLLGADVAVADWDGMLSGIKTPDGTDAPAMKHHVTIVLKHEGGEWLFVAARPVIYAVKPAPSQMH